MRYQAQRYAKDCGVAALSMVTEILYDDVASFYQPRDFNISGIHKYAVDEFLAVQGFAVRRFYQFHQNGEHSVLRKHWPINLFSAPAYLCEVVVYENAPCNHWITMDENGKVYDPLTEELRLLSYYHKILNIAGVYPVSK